MRASLEGQNPHPRILVIDDEEKMCLSLKQLFEKEDYDVNVAFSAKEAFSKLQENIYNLIVCDIRMPDMGGIALLSKIGKETPVIMMTAYASIETARKAFKLGARDYLTKPFKFDELLVMAKQFIAETSFGEGEGFSDVLLRSKNSAFQQVCEHADKFSSADLPILITGESGVGKEVIADYIYSQIRNRTGSFIKLNCAAIPEALLEGELFGYEKGAFTGAVSQKVGKIEEADGGTLFLDEIGDMPLVLQAKILRFLQDFKIFRLGSNHPISIRTRIIAASNQNLSELVRNGQFRLDLYHRLSGVHLKVPSLRERIIDIEEFSRFFLERFNAKYKKNIINVDEGVFQVFKSYAWPGNIRELKYAIERAVVICDEDHLSAKYLPDSIYNSQEISVSALKNDQTILNSLEDYRTNYAKNLIVDALRKTNGNKVEAAKLLRISRQTLYNKIKSLGITNEFK